MSFYQEMENHYEECADQAHQDYLERLENEHFEGIEEAYAKAKDKELAESEEFSWEIE